MLIFRGYVGMAKAHARGGCPLDARARTQLTYGRNHTAGRPGAQQRNDIPGTRVDEGVLELVGLESVGRKRAGSSPWAWASGSIGWVSSATRKVPLFDERVNALHPEPIRWIRELMRGWPVRAVPSSSPAI